MNKKMYQNFDNDRKIGKTIILIFIYTISEIK